MTNRFQVTDNTDNPFLCDWSVTDYADGGVVHHPMTSENMANVMCELLNELHEENQELQSRINDYDVALKTLQDLTERKLKENEQLKSFIDDLTTKGTGRIDLANGYSYSVSAVLTNWKGDV